MQEGYCWHFLEDTERLGFEWVLFVSFRCIGPFLPVPRGIAQPIEGKTLQAVHKVSFILQMYLELTRFDLHNRSRTSQPLLTPIWDERWVENEVGSILPLSECSEGIQSVWMIDSIFSVASAPYCFRNGWIPWRATLASWKTGLNIGAFLVPCEYVLTCFLRARSLTDWAVAANFSAASTL